MLVHISQYKYVFIFIFGSLVRLSSCVYHTMFPPNTNVLEMILDNIKETLPIAPSDKRVITFCLYTRTNPRDAVVIHPNGTEVFERFNQSSSSLPVLRRKADTKILVHGFGSSGKDAFAIQTKNALLRNDDMNVVVVDWGPLSKGTLLAYPLVMRRSKFVAGKMADLILNLHRSGLVYVWQVHFIGLSLGSNIASMAARIVSSESGHKVQRITGLDPTFLYNFDCDSCIGGVSKTDATFVDIIHTNTWFIGVARPVGHVDYYPNGGLLQPGCTFLDASLSIYHWLHCPHVRAWLFYLESINHPYDFMSWPCDSWETFREGKCSLNTPLSPMGYHSSPLARGTYYLHTNADSPFGRHFDCSLPASTTDTPQESVD